MPGKIKFSWRFFTFSVIILSISSFGFILRYKLYPVAIVNGKLVSARTYFDEYSLMKNYYSKLYKVYESKDKKIDKLSDSDLKIYALDQIVDEVIIHNAISKSGRDLSGLAKEKVNKYKNDSDFANAVYAIYGIKLNRFKELVLIPQAEKDILSGHLFIDGVKFDEWLKEERKKAKVSIFSSDFGWDGEKVVKK